MVSNREICDWDLRIILSAFVFNKRINKIFDAKLGFAHNQQYQGNRENWNKHQI